MSLGLTISDMYIQLPQVQEQPLQLQIQQQINDGNSNKATLTLKTTSNYTTQKITTKQTAIPAKTIFLVTTTRAIIMDFLNGKGL